MEKVATPLEEGRYPSALEEHILTVLIGRQLYGLQISKAIEEASSGTLVIGVGSLYPTLRRLEQKGFVTSHWEANEGGDESEKQERGGARRRYYRITSKGSRVLANTQATRDRLLHWQPS